MRQVVHEVDEIQRAFEEAITAFLNACVKLVRDEPDQAFHCEFICATHTLQVVYEPPHPDYHGYEPASDHAQLRIQGILTDMLVSSITDAQPDPFMYMDLSSQEQAEMEEQKNVGHEQSIIRKWAANYLPVFSSCNAVACNTSALLERTGRDIVKQALLLQDLRGMLN